MATKSVKHKSKTAGKKAATPPDELRLGLIQAARKHFAVQGFAGASLKDIAEEAGVAGSLINYHFQDKVGLFRATIETFARDRTEAMLRILSPPNNRDEMSVRIQIFVEEMLASIRADPYTFNIIDREVQSGNLLVVEIFRQTMLTAFHAVEDFFKVAQDKGLVHQDLDTTIVAMLLFSSTCDSARKEALGMKFLNISFADPEWRAKFVSHVVGLFMRGVIK